MSKAENGIVQMTEQEYLSHTIIPKTSPHVRMLMLKSEAIAKQYDGSVGRAYAKLVAAGVVETATLDDSLHEDKIEAGATRGVIPKYDLTTLVKVGYICAADCDSCTRVRQIGTHEGDLSDEDIKNIGNYFRTHTEREDIILSGGDPMANPITTLKLLEEFENIDSIKIIRVGTRAHHHAPNLFYTKKGTEIVEKLIDINKNKHVVFQLNFQHADEITLAPETQQVIQLLTDNFTTVSQTVFLAGINDSYEEMADLFMLLYRSKVKPYYLYHCDQNLGIEGFVVDLNKEREIYTRLIDTLPGHAVPTFVIDVPGRGKIRVPSMHWDVDMTHLRDYDGNFVDLTGW